MVRFPVLLLLTLAAAEAAGGEWIPLFDGRSLAGWNLADGSPVRPGGPWRVEDGAIRLDAALGRGGHLLSSQTYGDFELVFEWKIAAKSNSGIKYRVQEFDGRLLGCEYQIIDDVDYGGLRPAQTTASLYDLYEPLPHEVLKPVGQFNRSAIIVCGDRIEHYLNGYRVVVAVVGSEAWDQRIAASKFADVDGFGRNRCGRLMLTDHGDDVWYRNIFIRLLARRSDPQMSTFGACRSYKSGPGIRNMLGRKGL